jgi:hypothetical protein
MFETIAATLARSLGVALGASRRNRVMRRIRAYHALAAELEEKDPDSADALRDVAAKWVKRFARLEEASLARKFDPATFFPYLFFLAPGVVGSFYAWTREGWWTWPAIVLSAFWTFIVLSAAWSQFWETEQAEQAEESVAH